MISTDAAVALSGAIAETRKAVSINAPSDYVLMELAERMAPIIDRHGGCSATEFIAMTEPQGLSRAVLSTDLAMKIRDTLAMNYDQDDRAEEHRLLVEIALSAGLVWDGMETE